MKLKLTTAVALLATAFIGASAQAASEKTLPPAGVWSGETEQTIPGLEEGAEPVDWSERITVRVVGGRLTSIGTSVRYVCGFGENAQVGDVYFSQGWKTGRGPALGAGGSFRLVFTHATNRFTGKKARLWAPVRIAGTLGAGGASGTFSVRKGNDCSGHGTWRAKRRF